MNKFGLNEEPELTENDFDLDELYDTIEEGDFEGLGE